MTLDELHGPGLKFDFLHLKLTKNIVVPNESRVRSLACLQTWTHIEYIWKEKPTRKDILHALESCLMVVPVCLPLESISKRNEFDSSHFKNALTSNLGYLLALSAYSEEQTLLESDNPKNPPALGAFALTIALIKHF
jgi:hypothetical protein